MLVIAKAIEILKRRPGIGGSRSDFRAVRMEIPQQGHGSHRLIGRGEAAMEILHGIKEPILIVHQSVYRITGSRRLGQVKGDLEGRSFRLQPQDFLAFNKGRRSVPILKMQ